MSHFFAYLSRMRYIRRWNIMRNSQSEDILQHSAQCAMIAHALAVIGNERYGRSYDCGRITVKALYHEAAEVITGDLATPIKYFNPAIRESYGRIERVAEERLLSMLPSDLRKSYLPLISQEADGDHAIVKAADKLCAAIKCREELRAGNAEFEKAAEKIMGELAQNPLPEVAYFIENFLPSFSLTLDELN